MIAAGIGHLRAFERQGLLATKGANQLKMELFDAVAHLESGLTQLSNALNDVPIPVV
jgi:hypothetical protein